ncbi:MAG: hybrid sensor histidine kinase/response regulator, partial [Gemmataceae bacterium]
MADPLLHLLRNAVDHGLESAEVRVALGKKATGAITLKAGHEGSQVVLRISDDGRGIDPEAIRRTAVTRGVATAEEADQLQGEALYALLFRPGFSTKQEVSELSGRGVGLDVVKTKVESLKGTVSIQSVAGQGTTFIIRLPMTLAVTRALMVKSQQETFAIPLDAVEQILRLEAADVQRIGRDPVLHVGGNVVPVAYLGRMLQLRQAVDESVERPPVLILNIEGRRLAVVVEQLLGGREVVIKNLGTHITRVKAVSGATLLGDGRVVLILNPPELLRTASTNAVPSLTRGSATPAAHRNRATIQVLIVDDSPSVRRVLTTLVERNGWQAVAAKDGLEAIETLQRGAVNPQVVLSDVEMPRMDGYELLGTLRGMTQFQQLPVVMITSRAAEKHRRKAMELGASAYVTKPYQDEALTEVIRQLVLARKS